MSLPTLDSFDILGTGIKISKYYELVDKQFDLIVSIVKINSDTSGRGRFRIEFFLFLYMIEVSIRDYFMGNYKDNLLFEQYRYSFNYIKQLIHTIDSHYDVQTDCMKYLGFFEYKDGTAKIEDSVYPKIMEFADLKPERDYDIPVYRKTIDNFLHPWVKQFIAYQEDIYRQLSEYLPDVNASLLEEDCITEEDICYRISKTKPEHTHLVCSECNQSMDNQKYVYYIYDFGKAPLCMECFEKKTDNYIPLHYEKKDIQSGYVVGGGYIDYDMSDSTQQKSNGLVKKILQKIKNIFD